MGEILFDIAILIIQHKLYRNGGVVTTMGGGLSQKPIIIKPPGSVTMGKQLWCTTMVGGGGHENFTQDLSLHALAYLYAMIS